MKKCSRPEERKYRPDSLHLIDHAGATNISQAQVVIPYCSYLIAVLRWPYHWTHLRSLLQLVLRGVLLPILHPRPHRAILQSTCGDRLVSYRSDMVATNPKTLTMARLREACTFGWQATLSGSLHPRLSDSRGNLWKYWILV